MPIYDKPVRLLMRDMVADLRVAKGQILSKEQVATWFRQRYPKIRGGTISAHLIRLSTNAPSRVHYHAKAGDDDLFFQLDGSHFRLYVPDTDPPPIREDTSRTPSLVNQPREEELEPPTEFAYERDLRNRCIGAQEQLLAGRSAAGTRCALALMLGRNRRRVLLARGRAARATASLRVAPRAAPGCGRC